MSHDHADPGHEHPSFLAHHFDDPQQQFDSGKLGIWLFLVTEVLFFSGMFCAYALYRSRNPEVFTFASQFLNTSLGAFNTGVLLFSSLTMAWGVRCAQLRQRGGLVLCLALTLACASLFLGVKAVEYTHKWDLGLLPAKMYQSQYAQAHEHHGSWEPVKALIGQVPMDWLTTLCVVPGLIVVGLAVWTLRCLARRERRWIEISCSLLITGLCFFVGVGVGKGFEEAEAHAAAEAHSHDDGHHQPAGEAGHDKHSSNDQASSAGHLVSAVSSGKLAAPGEPTLEMVDQKGGAGLFFSIYYCMTGVHAIHIIGGMIVLTWLLVRATTDVFHDQYFGPVDYVGLYWHLVDLIWIYLFPLLYLIR
ncbi:MAG TPA: cytochrome oxidase subunit III [Planctomycetaceae bacterium]|nr:cytochrome oxidase subunit III [Planctomycetaceae bacterium]